MSRREICATSAGHTLRAVSNRTWFQPGRINRAYQRTNLTELSGSQYGAGIITTKFQERAMNAYRAYDAIEERKWAEQSLTEEKQKWIDDRAQEIIDALPKEPSGLFRFSVPMEKSPYEGLRSDAAGEAYNDLISAVAYAQAEYDWDHRTGCPF